MNEESRQGLRYLLPKSGLSASAFCNTQSFSSIWTGWGQWVINHPEQQDDLQFFWTMLDQLLKTRDSTLKDQIDNKIEGESGPKELAHSETFLRSPWVLTKTVQGLPGHCRVSSRSHWSDAATGGRLGTEKLRLRSMPVLRESAFGIQLKWFESAL